MSPETIQSVETIINPWEQAELTAVLRLRQLDTPQARERIIDEIVTDGAELLDAPMTTRWSFHIQGGRMVTEEGEHVRDMWERGRRAKQKRAMHDTRFWDDYRRAHYETFEQIEFEDEVIPSFVHNTQITFTPYAQDQEDKFGADFIDKETHYKRDRKYGLIRILYQTSPDTAEVVSISVENSHKLEAFYAVAEALGHTIPEGTSPTDMLGQHIKTFVRPDERLAFECRLLNIFDGTLSEVMGGEYKQGRPKHTLGAEAYSFVIANQDILAVYTQEIDKLAADKQLVGEALLKATRRIRRLYMAALYERHQQHDQSLPVMVRTLEGQDYHVIQQHMLEAGYRIGQRGIRLIGCGTALDLDPMEMLENMSEDEFKQVLTSKEEKYDFDQKMFCVACQSPPKKDEKKKMCGPCGICEACDRKLKSKMRAA